MVVKLTVNLPDELRRRARAVAALRGETMSEIVRAALEDYVDRSLEDDEDRLLVKAIEARIAEGKERVYSHQEIWDEVEALERRGELPA